MGQVLASWSFTSKPLEATEHKRWLSVDPPFGMLIPGEKAVIHVRVFIDNRTAIVRRGASLARCRGLPCPALSGCSTLPCPALPAATSRTAWDLAARDGQELNKGQEQLEDILLLHLENGRDYFIHVTAQYARSCFGMGLDVLVRTPEPVRNVQMLASPADKTDYTSPAKQPPLSVPKVGLRRGQRVGGRGMHLTVTGLDPGLGPCPGALAPRG